MATLTVLGAVARGLLAGTMGTVAMTVSERLERSVYGRQASQVPGQAGARLWPVEAPTRSLLTRH
ncbi:hypothetical protein BH18ACT9_BH18ACT9_06720 [soil metagenome]